MSLDRAASAGFWSAIDAVSRQGITFLVTIVLARLLHPSDFGIIAFVSLFSSLAIVVVQGGLSTALVQRTGTTDEEESAVFWWTLFASLLIAIVMILARDPIAAYYGYPVLAPLMIIAAGQLVLSAIVSVHGARLIRQLQFATLAKVGVSSALVSGILGIGAALLGAGVWALAIQLGSAAIMNAVLMWSATDWRPGLHMNPKTLRPLLSFTWYLGLSAFLEVLYSQGFVLLIAKRYDAHDIGLYNRAMSMQALPSVVMNTIISRIALPLFSQRATDDEALRRGLQRASSMAMLVHFPAMCGLAVLSDIVLEVLYGSQWTAAAPLLSILAMAGMFMPVHAINLQLLLAQGKAGAFFRIEVAKKIVGIACVVVGSLYGMMGLAWGMVIASLFALFLNTYLTRRTIGYGVISQFSDLLGIFICSGIMVAFLLILRSLVSFSPVEGLLILVPAGAAVFFGVGAALQLRSFREGIQIWLLIVKKRPVGGTS